MPFLDVPTMLLMTAAASLTMAASLGAVRPGRREGISLWALGLMMHTSTYVLYALRGLVSDWASIVLANTLLSGTFAMVLAAVHQFQGRALPWRRMAVPVAATALLFAFFIDDYRARIVTAGVVPPLQLGMVLWSLWRERPAASLRGATLLSVGLVMEVLLLGVRGMLAATRDIPVEGLMQGNAMQSITFMAAFVVVILSSLGFILMGKDRSDADNRYFAAHDALTGLVNCRSLIMALERDVARAVRLREPYAVMLWTSITSSPSTTAMATWRATACCAMWRTCCARACGRRTWWVATGVKNSWSCCRTPRSAGPWSLPRRCAAPWSACPVWAAARRYR